ncbi:MAG TPA: 4Fe-4S binding protein [Dehalococcoidia bacterium]|nr:4Fe-4S binding protein [Dehalococcoidia bacterium]
MANKVLRKIVKIDEELCNGCGACAMTCAEGAIQIVGGKARLISEKYCDGLGACLGECPQGAITIEERESEVFDPVAAEHHLEALKARSTEPLPCGCPSIQVTQFEPGACGRPEPAETRAAVPSMLRHWPVQLSLVPPVAPFLQDADLLVAADCVPFAYPRFHEHLLKGKAVVVGCPKLDDAEYYQKKLAQILHLSGVRSLTVVHIEVPCCFGLVHIVQQAIQESGREIPLRGVTVGVRGEIKSESAIELEQRVRA